MSRHLHQTGTADSDYYVFIGSAQIEGAEYIFGFFAENTLANRFKDALTAVDWILDNF